MEFWQREFKNKSSISSGSISIDVKLGGFDISDENLNVHLSESRDDLMDECR